MLDVNDHKENAPLSDLTAWHERLGAAIYSRILQIFSYKSVLNLDIGRASKSEICPTCSTSQQTRSTFPTCSQSQAVHLLEVVYFDVCGLLETKCKGGAQYFATSIEQASKWTAVFPIKFKSVVFHCFNEFII